MHTVCSIWPIDRTLSGATTLGQSGPGGNGNERVSRIPQISKAGATQSDGLMSYPGHSLGGWGFLPLCRDAVMDTTTPADWTSLEPNLFYYLLIACNGKWKRWFHAYLKDISTNWNTLSFKIWILLVEFVFWDDNRYATSTS